MILAAEPGPESVFAWNMQYEFPLGLGFCIYARGVSSEALAEVDGLVGLPMRGEKASINVGNAAAAILYAVAATAQYGVKL